MKKLISKVLLAVIFTVGSCNFAQAEDGVVSIGQYAPANSITIMCGDGEVRISFETGEAEFIDCKVDEATRILWEGLKPYFEGWKKDICKD